jgi:Fe2+ or Zn2+ uptake regulation protein
MRQTKARTLITDIILSAERPIDTATVLQRVSRKNSSIDRATVFRTVKKLEKIGTIKRVDFGDGKARYESADHHHHHLVCTQCGFIDDITICGVDEKAAVEARSKGFQITSHSLEYFGLCGKCQ